MEKNKARGILGVRPGVTLQELTTAYRRISLKCHPDKPGGSDEKFQELTEAFNTLSLEIQSSKPEGVRSKFQFSNNPGSNKFREFEEMLNEFKREMEEKKRKEEMMKQKSCWLGRKKKQKPSTG